MKKADGAANTRDHEEQRRRGFQIRAFEVESDEEVFAVT